MTGRRLPHELDDAGQVGGAEDAVDLRHLPEDVPAVALGQAARDDERPAPPRLLELGQLEDRGHRILTGPIDESARVHDQALRVLGRRHQREAGAPSMPSISSEVDLVLGQPSVVR